MAQVAQLCEHQCPKVRVVATKALPGVLNIGDLRAIPLLVSRLEDSNKQVRLCALDALRALAVKGESYTITRLQKLMESEDADVRAVAAEANAIVVDTKEASA